MLHEMPQSVWLPRRQDLFCSHDRIRLAPRFASLLAPVDNSVTEALDALQKQHSSVYDTSIKAISSDDVFVPPSLSPLDVSDKPDDDDDDTSTAVEEESETHDAVKVIGVDAVRGSVVVLPTPVVRMLKRLYSALPSIEIVDPQFDAETGELSDESLRACALGCVQCESLGARRQREQAAVAAHGVLRPNGPYMMVEGTWYRKWQTFLQCDVINAAFNEPPPLIDNASLMTSTTPGSADAQRPRRQLMPNHDFYAVNPALWHALMQSYKTNLIIQSQYRSIYSALQTSVVK